MPSDRVCEAMLAYVRENPSILTGRVKAAAYSAQKMKEVKQGFANVINAAGGYEKDATQAMEYWNQWKREVLRRDAIESSYRDGTGGGSPSGEHFTQLERDLLALIGPDARGLTGIKQGGLSYGTMPPLNYRASKKPKLRSQQKSKNSTPYTRPNAPQAMNYSHLSSVALRASSEAAENSFNLRGNRTFSGLDSQVNEEFLEF